MLLPYWKNDSLSHLPIRWKLGPKGSCDSSISFFGKMRCRTRKTAEESIRTHSCATVPVGWMLFSKQNEKGFFFCFFFSISAKKGTRRWTQQHCSCENSVRYKKILLNTLTLSLEGTSEFVQSNPLVRAGSTRTGCSVMCPARFWISPRAETPQPFWAACSSIQTLSQ